MTCKHDCEQPLTFPKAIVNRAGLDDIVYRIGTYADMRAHMLARIDASSVLAQWTHRKPDDPGIALVEGAAIVGDILSFYQQIYANEAFLRTAKWRDSVADLVKVLGYRLAPGLGGHARFALGIKGDKPITVPQGTGIKAQLDGAPKPANFETSATVTGYPYLSQFHFYRPRYTPNIVSAMDTFYVDAASRGSLTLKAGDRILVGILRGSGKSLDHTQILTVDKTWQSFGLLFVKTKGGITSLAALPHFIIATPLTAFTASTPAASTLTAMSLSLQPALTTASFTSALPFLLPTLAAGLGIITKSSVGELRAYKLGGAHRHFGHNAPSTLITVDSNSHSANTPVSYMRSLKGTTSAPANPALSKTQMPLDGPANSIDAGTTLLVEANYSANSNGSSAVKLIVESKIRATDRQSLAWGPTTGASTVLTLEEGLDSADTTLKLDFADIRGMTFHEVEGQAFTLKAELKPISAATGKQLDFYGTSDEAKTLDKRTVLLSGSGSAPTEANAVFVDVGSSSTPAFHRVTLDRDVAYADFDHDNPTVTVQGNLVEATEGKTEDEVTLGDGDNRQIFQTFAIPKPPLTYLLDTTLDPPQAPELEIYVGNRLWKRVHALFASGPNDPVYVVRQDSAGNSFVQFGDGKTGARLPSGRGNVVAYFRSGSGSNGPLKDGQTPTAATRIAGLDKIYMPEPVTGGAAPESEDSARVAAPGRMQTLARLVSLADFEAEALAIAGVLKARATWSIADGAPHVVVTILTASESVADENAVADALLQLNRTRGPARYPVTVVQGQRRHVRFALTVGYDPTYREDDIRAGILDALGAQEGGKERTHGLFSLEQRQFGQNAHGSQVVAAVQNVPGVIWVTLTTSDLRTLLPHLSIAFFAPHFVALTPPSRRAIACPESNILALDAADVTLTLNQAQASEVS